MGEIDQGQAILKTRDKAILNRLENSASCIYMTQASSRDEAEALAIECFSREKYKVAIDSSARDKDSGLWVINLTVVGEGAGL